MISKKHLNILLIVFSIFLVVTWKIFSSADQVCNYHAEAYEGLELNQLSQELENTGLIGRIHGASATAQLFVLSVREPRNFFNHREFSLLPSDQTTQNALSQANRHDLVCIKGNFMSNPSPQKHIWVKSVKMLESWSKQEDFPPYDRTGELPSELLNQKELVGKVHAIGEGGQILVVEYKDTLFPIFVKATEYSQGLFRGDIIRLAYQIQQKPEQPIHLQLNLETEKPLEVIDAIVNWHNQRKKLVGKLVKFPQSPQLKFDVYAIEVETQGIARTFTLVNFEEMSEFTKIREKLATIWENHQETAAPSRNMQINPKVIIEATGKLNIVSPEQANPQILLDSVEDIQIQEQKV